MTCGILLAGNFLSRANGARQVSEELALRLPQLGWNVVCTSYKKNRAVRLIAMMGTAWRYRKAYSVASVDVFSGPAFLWTEAVCWTLRRAGKPYVLALHGGNLPVFAERQPRRVRRLLRSAAAITVPSAYLQTTAQAHSENVRLLPNPLELSGYRFVLREKPEPNLIWLRAFQGLYNPTLAVKVVASLAAQHPDARLTMVGPDKGDGSFDRTCQLAKELAVNDRCVFPGGVAKAEVPAWLNQGSIFLNTTNIDNTPVSVLEAMACGLCVVSTDVGGIPDLLEHEHDALLVPPDDPEAMTAAVSRLLAEPALAARLSQNGREKAERCDWSVVLPQWDELFRSVARNGRR